MPRQDTKCEKPVKVVYTCFTLTVAWILERGVGGGRARAQVDEPGSAPG
jgi:hypothetical protein